jgi:hypothetical protein
MRQPADVVVRPAIKHVPRSVVRDAHERLVPRILPAHMFAVMNASSAEF